MKEPDNYIFPIYSIGMDERRKVEVKKQNLKNVRFWMKKIIVELGLDIAITFYHARHSYATIMRNSGVPLEFISKALKHNSTKTTEIYLDSFEEEKAREHNEHLLDARPKLDVSHKAG